MSIPTENVGSLPRPAKLQAAIKDYDAGKITRQQLEAEQDAACLDSIKRMEATGAPIVSDGEQRASSFATYPLTVHFGRHRTRRKSRGRWPILRHLYRWAPRAAPAAHLLSGFFEPIPCPAVGHPGKNCPCFPQTKK